MLGVFLVNDVEAAFPTNDLVVRTPLLDTGTNFHEQLRLCDSTSYADEAQQKHSLPKGYSLRETLFYPRSSLPVLNTRPDAVSAPYLYR